LVGFQTGGKAAVAHWESLHGAWRKIGLYPLLLSPDLPEYFADARQTTTPGEIIAAAAELDGEALLERWATAGSSTLPDWSDDDQAPEPWEDDDPGPSGRDVLRRAFVVGDLPDGSTELLQFELLLTVIPCAEPWHIPAHLGFNNQSWSAAEHTAVLQHLNKLYGAQPATLSDSMLELVLERPPSTDEESLAAARLYDAYNDGGYDHYRSITRPNLAAKLKDNHVWSAWWD
jgi:hypothetical protein